MTQPKIPGISLQTIDSYCSVYECAESERCKRDKLIISKQNSGSGMPILYMHSDAEWREKNSVVFFDINSGLNIMDLSKQSNQQCHLYFSLLSRFRWNVLCQ